MKKIIIIFSVLFLIFIMFLLLNKKTYSVEDYSLYLYDNEDVNILKENIHDYIDLLDDEIIPVTSYNLSDILSLNYDFLVRFAIFNILDNEDEYSDKISYLDEYEYIDYYGNRYTTNKYVDINLIYEITDAVFGKRDYEILNEEINIKDGNISLVFMGINNFNMDINDLRIENNLNGYNVYVKYDGIDLTYVYEFIKKEERLVINNISVEG